MLHIVAGGLLKVKAIDLKGFSFLSLVASVKVRALLNALTEA